MNKQRLPADYIRDPSLLQPAWARQWAPPAWLFDFSQRAELMEHHGGRLMSFSHRADNNCFYPENSLEAVISCLLMGVDIVELDVRMTKDKILVLSHDNTVIRCTNAAQLRSERPEDFPQSDLFSQWTIEQIRQLRLLDGNGAVTPYGVAEFSHVLQICAGRMFMILDKLEETAAEDGKTEEQWRQAYLEPLMQQFDSTPSCVKGWHFAMENNWILGDYREGYPTQWTELINGPAKGKNLEAGTLPSAFDDLVHWQELEALGVDYIMTNHPLELVRYIAEKYCPKA